MLGPNEHASVARSVDEEYADVLAYVNRLDPELIGAMKDVDRSLILLALERSPLERVAWASSMASTLAGFRRAAE